MGKLAASPKKNRHAAALGSKGGKVGGRSRWEGVTAEERSAILRRAARKRWEVDEPRRTLARAGLTPLDEARQGKPPNAGLAFSHASGASVLRDTTRPPAERELIPMQQAAEGPPGSAGRPRLYVAAPPVAPGKPIFMSSMNDFKRPDDRPIEKGRDFNNVRFSDRGVAPTLTCEGLAGEKFAVFIPSRDGRTTGVVRRLAPLECERLQGFPGGWTCLCTPLSEWAKHPGQAMRDCKCNDDPRYTAMGNAVTVNVAEWLGRRLMEQIAARLDGGKPTFVSWFSGVGGLDLGLERAGFACAALCEQAHFPRKVLALRWPHVPLHDDVRTFGPDTVPRPDLFVGGFPCQDISVAGKRRGFEGERSVLFFEMVRYAREAKPAWGLLENVASLLDQKMRATFWVVVERLRECWPAVGWRVLDSQYFGVSQSRRRVFIVCGPSEDGVASVLDLQERRATTPR